MKQLLATIILLVTIVTANAQALNFEWAYSTGAIFKCVTTDNQGNVFVSGGYNGNTIDFDFGPGVVNLGTGGSFLAKYNAQGDYIFAFSLSATITNIARDNDGNVWVVGKFNDTIDVDPGVGIAELMPGNGNIFAIKYSADGNYITSFNVGGTALEEPEKIAVDGSNNLYIAGDFEGEMDMDPGVGTTTLISNTGGNGEDAFIAKYSATGTLQFAFKLVIENFMSMAVTNDDNLYVSGGVIGSFDADPGPAIVSLSSNGGIDGFWIKYGPSGNYIHGYIYDGSVSHIDVDDNKNLYITGLLVDNMDVDIGPGTVQLQNDSTEGLYVAKYDSSDNLIYGKGIQSGNYFNPQGIVADAQGNTYIYGSVQSTVDFNSGGAGGLLTFQGNSDLYLAKYDATGNFIFNGHLGSSATERPDDVFITPQGHLWMVGTANDTVDFDYGPGVENITPGYFIAKYNDGTVAINEVTPELPIKIYGAESKVFVDFSALSKTNAQIQILNVLGQTVYQTKHNQSNKLTINLTETGGQVYFVRIVNGDKSIAKKLWVD